MAAGSAIGMKVISIVVGIPVGIATKKAVERAWALARPDDPPRSPNDRDVRWGDAITWAALSGISIVVGDLITRRSSEVAFRAITGSEPPPAKPTKAEKKLAKAAEKGGIDPE
jgi:hypothetical protein